MIVQRLHDEANHLLTAMIVGGTPALIRRLEAVIKDHPRIAVGCTAETAAVAIERASEHQCDVVFLAVATADGEGLAAARRLAPGRAIVIIADRPDFAFPAFEFGAIDYLLTPIGKERLRATLQRIDRFFFRPHELRAEVGTPSSPNRLRCTDRVPLQSHHSGQGKTTELVPVTDVIWVESLQNYSIVQLPGGNRRSIKRTLTEWETLLPEREFLRAGRSHLIQLAKVAAIASPSRNEWRVHFHDVDQPLRLGRAAAGKLKAALRGSHSA